jgi:DNA-binding MarR family transcriptional regulator
MRDDLPSVSELTACTCLHLRMLTRRVTQLYDAALEPASLTITQFSLLANLLMSPDVSMGALAKDLMMDPTTLTRTLRPLEERGLISIQSGENDRRRRSLSATPAGRAAFKKAVPLWRAARSRLADNLGTRDIGALDAALAASLETLAGA